MRGDARQCEAMQCSARQQSRAEGPTHLALSRQSTQGVDGMLTETDMVTAVTVPLASTRIGVASVVQELWKLATGIAPGASQLVPLEPRRPVTVDHWPQEPVSCAASMRPRDEAIGCCPACGATILLACRRRMLGPKLPGMSRHAAAPVSTVQKLMARPVPTAADTAHVGATPPSGSGNVLKERVAVLIVSGQDALAVRTAFLTPAEPGAQLPRPRPPVASACTNTAEDCDPVNEKATQYLLPATSSMPPRPWCAFQAA